MLFKKGSRLLVVAAHPDDETLGCGGTILKAISMGVSVSVLFLGEGISARFDKKDYNTKEFLKATNKRQDGCIKALKILGVKDFEFNNYYCCQFDKINLLTFVKIIEKKIKKFNPDTIITHNINEVNIDHIKTFEALEVASRPFLGSNLKLIVGMEIPCSGNWKFNQSFKPNFFVDINKFWKVKIKAWKCYKGEERQFPFPRSVEGIETMAKLRGMQSGLIKAEGFKLFRQIISKD